MTLRTFRLGEPHPNPPPLAPHVAHAPFSEVSKPRDRGLPRRTHQGGIEARGLERTSASTQDAFLRFMITLADDQTRRSSYRLLFLSRLAAHLVATSVIRCPARASALSSPNRCSPSNRRSRASTRKRVTANTPRPRLSDSRVPSSERALSGVNQPA